METKLFCIALTVMILLGVPTFVMAEEGGIRDSETFKVNEGKLLATLHLQDGTIIQFLEVIPGEIAFVAQTLIRDVSIESDGNTQKTEEIDFNSLRELNAVETYEFLSGGEEPPAALVEAQQRVDEGQQVESNNSSVDEGQQVESNNFSEPKEAAKPNVVLRASSDWFKRNYCIRQGDGFCRCYLWRTGSGSISREVKEIQSSAYAYYGNVTHELRYRSCFLWWCNWHSSIKQTVPQGYVGTIRAWGSKGQRQARIYDANGDTFHWAVVGYNDLGCMIGGGGSCPCTEGPD